jgi:poly-gamma-glutamate synthesis protein (capsule biosynthesis protein)
VRVITAFVLAWALVAPPRVFADETPTEPPPPSGVVRLMAVGDVMLGQSIGRRITRNGPLAPWQKVTQYFDQADLVVANLECTISNRGTKWLKTFTFRAPTAAAASLAAGGVDLVTVANNHAIDYGFDAFADTLSFLDAAGVGHVGGGVNLEAARAPLIVERNGLRIAFLGYVLQFAGKPRFSTRQWAATNGTPGVALGNPDIVAHDVAAAKQLADVVVVMVHGGIEYSFRPNAAQKNFDRAAIAAGATLVIGAHPHVLQGYALENGTAIAYSTGDFVFDYFTGDPNDTAILDVTLTAAGVQSLSWIPIEIDHGFPRPANAEETARIMSHLRQLPMP